MNSERSKLNKSLSNFRILSKKEKLQFFLPKVENENYLNNNFLIVLKNVKLE